MPYTLWQASYHQVDSLSYEVHKVFKIHDQTSKKSIFERRLNEHMARVGYLVILNVLNSQKANAFDCIAQMVTYFFMFGVHTQK